MNISKRDLLLIELDSDGFIEYANKKFRDISGYSKDDLVGKKYIRFLNDHASHDLCKDAISSCINGFYWEGYFKTETKDGDYFWSKINFQSKKIDDNIVGFLIKQTYATQENIDFMEFELKKYSMGMTVKSKNCGIVVY